MKKLILSILISVVALASYGQGFTKNQLYTGINQNIRLKTASQARTAAMMDSIVASIQTQLTFTNGLTNTTGTVGLGGTLSQATAIDFDGNSFELGSIVEGGFLSMTPTEASLTTDFSGNGLTITVGGAVQLNGSVGDLNLISGFDVNIGASGGEVNISKAVIAGGSKVLDGNTEANYIIDPRVGTPSAPSNGGIWYENGTGFFFREEGVSKRPVYESGNQAIAGNKTFSGNVILNGGVKIPTITLTTATTLSTGVCVVFLNGSFTVTLPTSVGNNGTLYEFFHISAGTVTIDGNGSETINGSASVQLTMPDEYLRIISDGANWRILNN